MSAPQDPLNIRGTSAPAIQIAKALAIAKGSLSLSLSVDPLSALLEQLVHSDNGKVVPASCPGTDVLSVLQTTQFWCVGTRDISRLRGPPDDPSSVAAYISNQSSLLSAHRRLPLLLLVNNCCPYQHTIDCCSSVKTPRHQGTSPHGEIISGNKPRSTGRERGDERGNNNASTRPP